MVASVIVSRLRLSSLRLAVPVSRLRVAPWGSRSFCASDDWKERLEERRRARLTGAATASTAAPKRVVAEEEQRGEAWAPSEEEEEAMREQVEFGSLQMQMFAYPSSRRFPWVTTALLLTSCGLSAGLAVYWHFSLARAYSVEEMQPKVRMFASALSQCTLTEGDVSQGRLHPLLLASLVRAGEQPARAVLDAAVLVVCGTLVERLHGSAAALAILAGGTALSNAAALPMHRYHLVAARADAPPPSVTSTSGGIVTLGVFVALKYGRWAVWPGVPLPIAWLLAPLLVADVSAMFGYSRHLRAYMASGQSESDDEEMSADEEQHSESPKPAEVSSDAFGGEVFSGFDLAVALAACEVLEDQSRTQYRQLPEDIACWRDDLELLAQAEPERPPDGAFLGDVAAAALGVVLALAVRRS